MSTWTTRQKPTRNFLEATMSATPDQIGYAAADNLLRAITQAEQIDAVAARRYLIQKLNDYATEVSELEGRFIFQDIRDYLSNYWEENE